jgi:hypothetical protein
VAPNTSGKLWHDNGRFFNKGTSGQWRDLLDAEGRRRYADQVAQLGFDHELVEWAHHGPILD